MSLSLRSMLAGALLRRLHTKTTISGANFGRRLGFSPLLGICDLLVKLTYLHFMILRVVVKMCN